MSQPTCGGDAGLASQWRSRQPPPWTPEPPVAQTSSTNSRSPLRSLDISVDDDGVKEGDARKEHWTAADGEDVVEWLWVPDIGSGRKVPSPDDVAALVAELETFGEIWVGATDVQASFCLLRSLATLAGVPPLDGGEVRSVLAQLASEALARKLGDRVAGCRASVVAKDTAIELRLRDLRPSAIDVVEGDASSSFLQEVTTQISGCLAGAELPSSAPRATRKSTFAQLWNVARGSSRPRCLAEPRKFYSVVATVFGRPQEEDNVANVPHDELISDTSSADPAHKLLGPTISLRTIERMNSLTALELDDALQIVADLIRDSQRVEMRDDRSGAMIFVADMGDLRFAPSNPLLASIVMAEYADLIDSVAGGCNIYGRKLRSLELRGKRGCSVKMTRDWAYRMRA